MNFTYVLEPVKDDSFGTLKDDGSWTGLVGSLISNECDMGK